MILALFLLELTTGLCVLLPLVGRRNAGPKFYRLILVLSLFLLLFAGVTHVLAGARTAAVCDGAGMVAVALLLAVLRFPTRLVYRVAGLTTGVVLTGITVYAYELAVNPPSVWWSIAGALSSSAIVGSVMLAMLLGHWYLVVRGMPIEPLMRLSRAFLIATIAKVLVVAGVLLYLSPEGLDYGTPLHRVMVGQGIFFWMRAGWGLVGPLALYPMIWGTVKIRSTMAATGILYVAVVAVIIGEVLAAWLSALERIPL